MRNPFERNKATAPKPQNEKEMPELGQLSAKPKMDDAGQYYYELSWIMGKDGYEPWIGAGEETINTIKRDTAEEAEADLERTINGNNQRQQERIDAKIKRKGWEKN